MRDTKSRRRPAPYHECHAFSGLDRNTNRTFVAVHKEGTWLHAPTQVLPPPARRMPVLGVRETDDPMEQCKEPALHSVLRRDTLDLSSSDLRLRQLMHRVHRSRSWCRRLEPLSLKPCNKWERGSYIHELSSVRSRKHPESCAGLVPILPGTQSRDI